MKADVISNDNDIQEIKSGAPYQITYENTILSHWRVYIEHFSSGLGAVAQSIKHCQILRDELQPAIPIKRTGRYPQGVALLHDKERG